MGVDLVSESGAESRFTGSGWSYLVTFAEAHAVLGQVRTLAVLVDLHDGPGLALELRP